MPDLAVTSARIDDLLGRFERAEPQVADRVDELLSLVVEMYGDGLSRVVGLVAEQPGLLERLAADDQVAGLLSLHGLHPAGVVDRVQGALDQVRPYLGSHAGGVELLGVDPDGVARLRLRGSCDGCASSLVTVKLAIERAVLDTVPEVVRVEVENLTPEPGESSEAPLIPLESLFRGGDPAGQVQRSPAPAAPAATGVEVAGAGTGAEAGVWAALPEPSGLSEGEVRAVEIDGVPVVLCAAGGHRYAYRDRCPRCQGGFAGAVLDGVVMACPRCGGRYDVHLAGRCPDWDAFHLDPLPLLGGPGSTRIALGLGAPA